MIGTFHARTSTSTSLVWRHVDRQTSGSTGHSTAWRGAVVPAAVVLLATIVAMAPASARASEQAKLAASDGAPDDSFGAAAALDGDTLAVGAPSAEVMGNASGGAAYVFTRTDGIWEETAKLTASDAAETSRFGLAVAIDGDTLVVGSASRVAYVFTRTAGTWSETARLTASDDRFRSAPATSVAISGDTLVHGGEEGTAYVFTRTAGIWMETAKLIPSEEYGGNRLGDPAVAISGDTVVVADRQRFDPAFGTPPGRAFVFAGAGDSWTETAFLTASDGGPADWFGTAVALTDDTLAVGAAIPGREAAYVFAREADTWTETAKLTADDDRASGFGRTVALAGDTLVVGSIGDDVDEAGLFLGRQGAVYIFTRAGNDWIKTSRLTASDREEHDVLGSSVAVTGNTVVGGAPTNPLDGTLRQGAAYVFELFRRHFAEGATGFFQTDLGLFNTSPDQAAEVLVTLNPETADEAVAVPFTLEPFTRQTVDVNQAMGGQATGVSIHVVSSEPLAATRQMRWDAALTYGSTLESGVPETATTWYFAEGATYVFNLFYLVANPNDAQANVTIRYLRGEGEPVTQEIVLPAQSRRTVWANAVPGVEFAEVAAVISADLPIVAERAMYFGPQFDAGAASSGASALGTEWFFAEGSTSFFDTFLTFGNPGDTAAEVTVTYQLPDGSTLTRTHAVPAASRRTVLVSQEDPRLATTAVAMAVSSSEPIIAERVMWWGPTAEFWYEAHATVGATETGTRWAIGEGASGGQDAEDTFVLVANAAEDAGDVRLTVVRDDGATADQTFALAGHQRLTIRMRDPFPEVEGQRFSLLVESLANGGEPAVPITVEYVRYQSTNGRFGNAGGTALATRLE